MMTYTIEQLRKHLYSKIYEIYDVFKNYFTEAHVDLQNVYTNEELINAFYGEYNPDTKLFYFGEDMPPYTSDNPFILVWWPEVKVTNEYDKSVMIQDLYAKVILRGEGTYRSLYFNRSTYTALQYVSGYIHSHISGIDKNDLSKFSSCCLGRGPINNTIDRLRQDITDKDERDIIWLEFCKELDTYVTVESLQGGPYRKLEEIGYALRTCKCRIGYSMNGSDWRNQFKKLMECAPCSFIKFYLENGHFRVKYTDGHYQLNMSEYDVMLDISNAFIKYYNMYTPKDEFTKNYVKDYMMLKVYAQNNQLYYESGNPYPTASSISAAGTFMFKFKGKDICLRILEDDSAKTPMTHIMILSPNYCGYLVLQLLNLINIKFKNEHSNNKRTALPGKTKFYF